MVVLTWPWPSWPWRRSCVSRGWWVRTYPRPLGTPLTTKIDFLSFALTTSRLIPLERSRRDGSNGTARLCRKVVVAEISRSLFV